MPWYSRHARALLRSFFEGILENNLLVARWQWQWLPPTNWTQRLARAHVLAALLTAVHALYQAVAEEQLMLPNIAHQMIYQLPVPGYLLELIATIAGVLSLLACVHVGAPTTCRSSYLYQPGNAQPEQAPLRYGT